MKKTLFIIGISAALLFGGFNSGFAQTKIEIASSPNPVGSGARALGMGGAFISMAKDATAASWNPACLNQLRFPEMSVVGSWFHREEDNTFEETPDADGTENVWKSELNYFSAVYPTRFLRRKMVFSLNYQNLYDFTREWDFFIPKIETSPRSSHSQNVHYKTGWGPFCFGTCLRC